MVIELYDMRGLKEVFIGSLNLDLNQENEYSFSNTLTSNVSKLGKKVGCLHFKCEIIRKEDIGNKIWLIILFFTNFLIYFSYLLMHKL